MQADVNASGYLPDGCTKITDTSVNRDGDSFNITIMTERPAHIVCTQALVPFEETIAIDIVGLKAGTYTVIVNDIRETFVMQVDNVVAPEE
jgi:inhibitor of cysteine peptidase